MAKSRVIFCRRDGSMIAEIDCNTTRSWAYNDAGQAEITIPKTEPKLREEIVRFGNRIIIINDKVELWGGVIYPPRKWSKTSVSITAFSGEYLLKFRGSGALRSNNQGDGFSSAGLAVMTELMNAQSSESLGIVEGNVSYTGSNGAGFDDKQSLFDAVQKLAESNHFEWSITPSINNANKLVFELNWVVVRGIYRQNFYLVDGHNIADGIVMEEQGPLFNRLNLWTHIKYHGPPDAEWDDQHSREHKGSIALYGLMELEESSGQTVNFGQENPTIVGRLQQTAFGRKTFQITALDVGDTFANLEVGDVVNLILPNMGFKDNSNILGSEDRVRILGKSYDDLKEGELELVVDSVENFIKKKE